MTSGNGRPLTREKAIKIANLLLTIGHPYSQAAIEATAGDLVEWCQGVTVGQVEFTPEEQAAALVADARTWPEGWPERGGTQKLRELFDGKYSPPELRATVVEMVAMTAADAVAKGLLAPPCQFCRPGAEHCEYGGPRSHKHALDFWEIPASSASTAVVESSASEVPGKTLPRATLEQLLRDAEANHREDLQRKNAALQKIEGRYDDGYRI